MGVIFSHAGRQSACHLGSEWSVSPGKWKGTRKITHLFVQGIVVELIGIHLPFHFSTPLHIILFPRLPESPSTLPLRLESQNAL